MEFAVGSVARVFGPDFADIDHYPVRVRLPDEPLMLVDRILEIEGNKGVPGAGRIVTEHDVRADAWYLDGGRAPLCISIEAGQADLFLSSYLGIDFQVKGRRAYRLLDATVRFHRGLPRPGETLRYEIHIDRFIRQGETWLFFFRFRGDIDGRPMITMTNGCAGFFTAAEVENSGGVILTAEEKATSPGKGDWRRDAFTAIGPGRCSAEQLDQLRAGNLAGCFGAGFEGVPMAESLRIPGGKMKLIDRVIELDPAGGRFGNGLIRAEADIDPRAWFLACHFVDDKVMPGTLMFEYCAHTLRVFLQRMGWLTDREGAVYEPLENQASNMRCRGPVTPDTRCVRCEVEIREIGFSPEPYVIADAHMFADDHRIVRFQDLSLKLSGTTREDLQRFWSRHRPPARPLFDQAHILAFARGNPSEAFGDPYRPFDRDRFIARLPAPPYSFLHRVVAAGPRPWHLAADGWATLQYDVSPNDWYFQADRNPVMPYCVLLEIALQGCGWLAAYMGSALHSAEDLRFRNLGGSATVFRNVFSSPTTLTVETRLNKVSAAGGLLIEEFRFVVSEGMETVFQGHTGFGFFTQDALGRQKGIRNDTIDWPSPDRLRFASSEIRLPDHAPLMPDDAAGILSPGPHFPARALRMVDRVDAFQPDGGPSHLGYVRGTKFIDPGEWFFRAHFYQDPVCPGSLGIESMIQLLKFLALEKWPVAGSGRRFAVDTGSEHHWTYRGQIIPQNREVTVEAMVRSISEEPDMRVVADGRLWVDGLHIYSMKDIGIRLLKP